MILETPATRSERIDYLAAALDGLYAGRPVPADTVGGRAMALERLRAFEPQNYGRMRHRHRPGDLYRPQITQIF